MNITSEQMQNAKKAKSVEELLAIAKESGMELTEEQAKQFFAELHKTGELTDDELDSVAGGNKNEEKPEPKQYNVFASDEPSCNGRYEYVSNAFPSQHCGSCKHFSLQAEIDNSGYCTREFD